MGAGCNFERDRVWRLYCGCLHWLFESERPPRTATIDPILGRCASRSNLTSSLPEKPPAIALEVFRRQIDIVLLARVPKGRRSHRPLQSFLFGNDNGRNIVRASIFLRFLN